MMQPPGPGRLRLSRCRGHGAPGPGLYHDREVDTLTVTTVTGGRGMTVTHNDPPLRNMPKSRCRPDFGCREAPQGLIS